ncbi:hypothetical protein M8C21_034014 [Ambrosia artemisiifolia]|uniref:Uncharacterized protein n=1 Tax=Ambrosia artemisiifolia TaxID=4212 RepID=A0AAD5GQ33_AMBAR|nr:hypothetical protein M8C21_034014 [Ambrosia artemisiifolia]
MLDFLSEFSMQRSNKQDECPAYCYGICSEYDSGGMALQFLSVNSFTSILTRFNNWCIIQCLAKQVDSHRNKNIYM